MVKKLPSENREEIHYRKNFPPKPWGPVKTCTEGRWVAAALLRCFQHPAVVKAIPGGLQAVTRANRPFSEMWV